MATVLALLAATQQVVGGNAGRQHEELQVIQGGVRSPWKSLTEGDLLEVDLLDPPSATFDGPARLYFAFDDPAAVALGTIQELPDDLAAFSSLPVAVQGGRLAFPVMALGPMTHLSLFVARIVPLGVLVSPVVQVTITRAATTSGRIDPARIAVFANVNSPQSMAVAAAYMAARDVPPGNLYAVSFNAANPDRPALRESEFVKEVQPAIDALPPSIDLIALSWTLPYKVTSESTPQEVASITSAFMLGLGPGNFVPTVQGGCVVPSTYEPSPLYDADARDYGQAGLPRPTMILGGRDLQEALDLVARGAASDGTHPILHGLLVSANPARSLPRTPDMLAAVDLYAGNSVVDLEWHDVGSGPDPIGQDLLLYQTGDFEVEDLGLNGFLPGAVADNLDSWGGNLEAPVQGHMNVMEWLATGVTASYGAVREPCSFAGKFPRTSVLVRRYLAGESLAEAYVKSVEYPQEGVFVGDPAACPYCR